MTCQTPEKQTQSNPIRSPNKPKTNPNKPTSQRSADPRMPAPACLRQGSLSGAPITTHEYQAPSIKQRTPNILFGIFTTNIPFSAFYFLAFDLCPLSFVPRETFPSLTPHSQTSWQHLYHYKQTHPGHSERSPALLLVQDEARTI